MQPGQTIDPGAPAPEDPPQTQPEPLKPEVSPSPPPAPEQAPQPEPEAQTPWTFQGGAAPEAVPATPQFEPISWTASEYIAHHKDVSWFLLLGLVIVVLAAVMYFFTRDVVPAVVIGVVGLIFGISGARKPQVLGYMVDGGGVHIGNKSYPYTQFRSFSVLDDDGVHSILLMPAQRFGLPINIYYEPQDEVTIVEALGMSLPLEERQVAPIDRFMSKIRF